VDHPVPDPPPPAGEPGDEPGGGRLAAARQRAEEAAAIARERVEAARLRSPFVRRAFDVVDRDAERLGGLLAGALAYRLFLWLLPFVLLLVGALGAFTSVDDETPDHVVDDFGLQGALADAIADGAEQRGWWIAVVLGLSGTLWAGIGASKAVRISHAAAWGLPRGKPLSPVRATLAFNGLAVLIIATVILAARLREAERIAGIVATLLVVLLFFVLWMFVQSRLPHRRGHWTQLVPGALLVAAGVQAVHLLTVWYLVDRAERASSTYGAIGTALVILVWLYVVARLVIGAAVLNAELARRPDDTHGRPLDEPPRWSPDA
jgi:uncharacterized BrkB/YihY/UPF0761 family membrane protein